MAILTRKSFEHLNMESENEDKQSGNPAVKQKTRNPMMGANLKKLEAMQKEPYRNNKII